MSGPASERLQAYFAALQRADTASLKRLVGPHTLLENPFLNPPRLFGDDEIARAHRALLERLEAIEFRAERLLGDARHAIASGRLSVTPRGEPAREFAVGVVVDCAGDSLRRLSLYCDTRGVRRWSDEAIL